MVICDQINFCVEAKHCGGAQPHEYDGGSECNACPINKKSKCVPVVESKDE